MAIVRDIIRDALTEIGALGIDEPMSAPAAQLGLLRLQNQLDAWAADRLTIFNFTRVLFTLTSGTSTITIGPTGDVVTVGPRPNSISGINYVIPGTSPAVETPMGPMDDDSYMNNTIKGLSSSLPTQWWYNEDVPDGGLIFWPVVTQNVQLAIYYPATVGIPADLDTVLIGPQGYQESFLYQLALRLCTPYSRPVPALLPQMAAEAYARIKRGNTQPGLLGTDQALHPTYGGAYNILNDTSGAPSR